MSAVVAPTDQSSSSRARPAPGDRPPPSPDIKTCTATRTVLGLLAPEVTLEWQYPSPGYTAANAHYRLGSNPADMTRVKGNHVSTTGPVDGLYTTTFHGGLLEKLLGGRVEVGISTAHASGWSSPESAALATFPPLAGTIQELPGTSSSVIPPPAKASV